jgi:ribosomal protein L29
MSNYARSFDATRFDFENKGFIPEPDKARPTFFYKDALDAKGDLVKKEMIKISSPGESLSVYGGPVRECDRQRFSKAYEAFIKGEELMDGTPLSKWGDVASTIEFMSQLRAYGFQTVEDIANMTDGAERLFHGSQVWKKKAQVFLAEQNRIKSIQELEAKESAKDTELADLRQRLAALEAPKKRGRPKKVA